MCKATNRKGTSEISHYVLYEGKEAHIAENIHGVFHHDQSRIDRAKTDVRGGILPTRAEAAVVEEEQPKKEEEDKGRKGGRGSSRASSSRVEASPAPSVAPPPSEPAEPSGPPPTKPKEPRDSRIAIHFPTKLSNRVVAEGSKVKLTCYLEGADPAVKWLKDDQPVVYSAKCRQSNNNGLCILELNSVTAADTGSYKCYARNLSGEASTTAHLEVYASPGSADLEPTFTRSLKDAYHANINEINLSCHVRGMPTPTITWVKDGVTLQPNEKYQQIENDDGTCELNVNDATNQDSGKYSCQAENRAGRAEITHLVQVQVQARSQRNSIPTPPRAASIQPPSTPNNEENKEGGKGRKRQTESQSSGVDASAGLYERRREIPIPPDPKNQLFFVAFLSDRTVSENGKTKLSCYAEGPDPQVRWFKDDQQLVNGTNVRAEMRDGLCTLTLTNLLQENSGEYRVLLRNQFSEIQSTCRVVVYENLKQEGTAPIFTTCVKGKF